jgi:dCTP deaminase
MLSGREIADRIEASDLSADPLVITPKPELKHLRSCGASSVDLRLGCWFLTLRYGRVPYFNVYERGDLAPSESKLVKRYYVPFGQNFILHPRNFVLAATLEWIRLPSSIGGYVIGRSSWGRHGLIIATATGVHPGFTGCLTLELSNVGEVPITVRPAAAICQLFLHSIENPSDVADRSRFVGYRRPTLNSIELDEVAKKLAAPY